MSDGDEKDADGHDARSTEPVVLVQRIRLQSLRAESKEASYMDACMYVIAKSVYKHRFCLVGAWVTAATVFTIPALILVLRRTATWLKGITVLIRQQSENVWLPVDLARLGWIRHLQQALRVPQLWKCWIRSAATEFGRGA